MIQKILIDYLAILGASVTLCIGESSEMMYKMSHMEGRTGVHFPHVGPFMKYFKRNISFLLL